MRIFDYSKLKGMKLNTKIVNLLTSIHESKGRQELYLKKQPEELDRLIEIKENAKGN